MSAPDPSWDHYDETLPFAATRYGSQNVRMAVIGLGGGDLLVVSPGAPLDEARWEQVARWGTPRFLLAPNHFHSLGIGAWKARYPEAVVVAHPRAHRRLQKKLSGIDIHDLATLEAALPSSVGVFGPPMAKQGETWVSVETQGGRAWFVTDAFVNEERLTGATGLLLRLCGFRPGLIRNPFFTRFFVEDRAAYAAWFEEALERDRPQLFVPAHGKTLRGPDVVAELRAAFTRA